MYQNRPKGVLVVGEGGVEGDIYIDGKTFGVGKPFELVQCHKFRNV